MIATAMLAIAGSMGAGSPVAHEITSEPKRSFKPHPNFLPRGPSGYRRNKTNDCTPKTPRTAEDYDRIKAGEAKRELRRLKRQADREATMYRLNGADLTKTKSL